MAVRKRITCVIDSTLPRVTDFVTNPAKKKVIFLTYDEPDNMDEDPSTLAPYDFKSLEDKEMYRLLQDPKMLPVPRNWRDLHLLGE